MNPKIMSENDLRKNSFCLWFMNEAHSCRQGTPLPKTSLTEIIQLINEYSTISDYTIIQTKSTVLLLNMKPHDTRIQDTQFTINNITYLGINISQNLLNLFNLNFITLLKPKQGDLTRWMNISLSETNYQNY